MALLRKRRKTKLRALTPPEKAADKVGGKDINVDGGLLRKRPKVLRGLMLPSAHTVRERSSLAGFTLVELLIVIIIVAVLVGVAVPGYYSVRSKMEDEKAKFNLTQIYNAQKAYKVDKQTYAWDIDELRGYIDFSDDDSHWEYFVDSADATSFVARARNLTDNRILRINQNNDIY